MSEHGQQLGDGAENMKLGNGVEQAAKTRLSALFQSLAHVTLNGPLPPGEAERFLLHDDFEAKIPTNQGDFVIVIRRG